MIDKDFLEMAELQMLEHLVKQFSRQRVLTQLSCVLPIAGIVPLNLNLLIGEVDVELLLPFILGFRRSQSIVYPSLLGCWYHCWCW